MKTMTEDVATWKVQDVERKIDALNRRAKKLGLPGVTMEKGEESLVRHELDCPCCGGLRADSWTPVTVSGEAVRIDGWQLVAVLDHGVGEKPIVRGMPGAELPERYRDAKPICDHCGHDRRRKDTFVLEKDGEHTQVGRTCLGDYLGENTAQAIVAYATWISQIGKAMLFGREPNEERSGEEARWDLVGFLIFTAAEIKANGWVSMGQAKDDIGAVPTADCVLTALRMRDHREEAKRLITEEMMSEAAAAAAWAAEVEPDNDYLHNIRVLAEAGWTNSRNAGYAASILPAYRREVEREIKTRLEVECSADVGYFGEPGERVRGVVVMVASLREISRNYNRSMTIVGMRTREGHNLKWFASGCPNLDRGESYLVDMTVKGHEVYQGVLETRVNRVTVLSGA